MISCHLSVSSQQRKPPSHQVVPVCAGAPPVREGQMPEEPLVIEDEGDPSPLVVHLVLFCWVKHFPANEE